MKKLLLIVVSIIIVGSLIYLNIGQYSATKSSSEKFESEFIKTNNYYEHEIDSNVGIIMYQGAKVAPESYAYLSSVNANVYISDFMYGIGFFNSNLVDDIIKNNPEVDTWYFAGHSLGGSIIYDQAMKNDVEATFMLGSYPMSKVEQKQDFESIAFFATNDGLIQDYEDKKTLYPENSNFVILDGANHAGYGDYGPQKGDFEATISMQQQQQLIVDTINNNIK